MPDQMLPATAALAASDTTRSISTTASTSPAAMYLAQLAKSGRRTMHQSLDTMAQLHRAG